MTNGIWLHQVVANLLELPKAFCIGAFPCDEGCDTTIELSFFRDATGTLRAYVSIYESMALIVVLRKSLTAAEEQTPFQVEGLQCIYDASIRCDWSNATCDIDG